MVFDFLSIKSKYDLAFSECYKRIENSLLTFSDKHSLIKTITLIDNESTLLYLIEIIYNIQEEDYGIIVDIQLSNLLRQCRVDVLKANGMIYSSIDFPLIKKNNLVDDITLDKSIDYINELPLKVCKLFISEYLNS